MRRFQFRSHVQAFFPFIPDPIFTFRLLGQSNTQVFIVFLSDKLNTGRSWFKRPCLVPQSMQIYLETLWAVSHIAFAGYMFTALYAVFSLRFHFSLLNFSAIVSRTIFGNPELSSPLQGFHRLLPSGPRFLWFAFFSLNSTYTIADFKLVRGSQPHRASHAHDRRRRHLHMTTNKWGQ